MKKDIWCLWNGRKTGRWVEFQHTLMLMGRTDLKGCKILFLAFKFHNLVLLCSCYILLLQDILAEKFSHVGSQWKVFFFFFNLSIFLTGLSLWLSGKESVFDAGELWFDPWVGKMPWRRAWQPAPVFLPGKSHGQDPWQSTGSQRVGHDWSNLAAAAAADS